jgi:N-acetylmuramoyl-L-alanine amidase
MGKRIIAIDIGHGGADPGAVYGAAHEEDINLAIGKLVAANLATHPDITPVLTRTADVGVTLGQRTEMANRMKATCFVSVHANSSPGKGPSGFMVIYAPGSVRGKALGAAITKRYISTVPEIKNLGERTDQQLGRGSGFRLYVLRRTAMPAVLIEVGFINNDNDRKLLTSPKGQLRIASAIAAGVVEWLG